MIGTLLEKLFVSVGVDLSGFGSELDRATQEVGKTANDMKRSFADVGKSWQQTGASMMKAGAVMAGAVTAPLLAAGAGIIKTAGDFEAGMIRIQIASEASTAEMAQMEKMALDIGKSTVFGASEAASAMEMLAKAGVDTKTILGGAAEAVTNLAAAAGSGLDPAASAITDTLTQFKMQAKDLPQIVNLITGAVNESKFEFGDFTGGMAQAGGVAGSAGLSFEDFAAALAATSSQFSSGSDAGTSFKTFLLSLNPKTKQAAALMEQFGLKFFDAAGKMKPIGEIAELLRQKFSKLSDEARNKALENLFGTDAIRTAVGLMNAGADGLDKIAAKLAATNAGDQAAKRMQGFNGQLDQLKGSLETLAIRIGQSGLLEGITSIVQALGSMIDGWAQASPLTLKFATGIGLAAAAIGPLIIGLGALVASAGSIVALLGGAGVAGALGAVAAAALPVVAVVAGLAATWALFGDKVGPVLSDLWTSAQEVLGPKFTALADTVSAALTALWQGPFGDAIKAVIAVIGEFGAAYTSILGTALIRVISAAVDVVSGAFTTIVNVIKLVAAALSGDWAGAWDAAKKLVSDNIAATLTVLNDLVPGATDAMKRLYDGVKTWIGDRLNAVWDGVQTKIETVKGWFFGLYDAVVGHSYIPDMVDEIGQNMARLQGLMVDPAKAATTKTKEAFRNLASDVSGVLDKLFPLQAQLRSVLDDIATLEKARAAGQIDAGTYDAARTKLDAQRRDVQGQISTPKWMQDIEPLTLKMTDLSTVIGELPPIATEAQMALQDFGNNLGNTLMSSLNRALTGKGSLQDVASDMLSRFFNRTITSALISLETAVFGDNGLGGFLGGLFSKVISGRAVGGPVVPGRAYTVGSGEKFVPSENGRVLSRNDAMAAAGGSGGSPGRISVTVNGARGNQEIMEMVRQGVQQGIGQYDVVAPARVSSNLKRRG